MKKKIIITIVTCVTLLSLLAACGQKVKCSFCGEEKIGTTKSFYGEEIEICNDCEDELTGWAGK